MTDSADKDPMGPGKKEFRLPIANAGRVAARAHSDLHPKRKSEHGPMLASVLDLSRAISPAAYRSILRRRRLLERSRQLRRGTGGIQVSSRQEQDMNVDHIEKKVLRIEKLKPINFSNLWTDWSTLLKCNV